MSYHSGNQLIDAHLLFEKCHLQAGMHVADFGAGRTGHLVFPASVIVGEKGLVYAVDILKDVLETIHKRAEMENILNVQTVWADIEKNVGVSIVPKTLDVVFMVNVLYHFEDYTTVLDEAVRLLKNKGRIVIVDWIKFLGGLGPKDGKFVNFVAVKNWARKTGLVIQEDDKISDYHRFLVLYRHD